MFKFQVIKSSVHTEMNIDLFDSFYISHFFSIQLGHFFEKSTSLTYYKWSKRVIFQFPRCNLFLIKRRLICSSWAVIRNIWMTAVKLHPEVSTLILAAPQTHSPLEATGNLHHSSHALGLSSRNNPASSV